MGWDGIGSLILCMAFRSEITRDYEKTSFDIDNQTVLMGAGLHTYSLKNLWCILGWRGANMAWFL